MKKGRLRRRPFFVGAREPFGSRGGRGAWRRYFNAAATRASAFSTFSRELKALMRT